VNSIYSILDAIAKITPKENTGAEKVSEPVEPKGSIVEGVKSIEERLKSKLQEFKSTVSEGEVCEKCDSTPCQCETTKEGIEDVPTFMRDKAGQPRLTMKDIKKPSAYQFRVGEKEFMSLGAAKEFAAGTGQQVEKIEEADMEEGSGGNQSETVVTDKGNRYTYVLGDDEMKAQIMFNGTEIHLQYDPNMQAFDPQESRAKDPILDKWLKRQQPFGSDEDSIDDFVDRAVNNVSRGPDMEEGNEFSGALAKAKASGAEEFEVDGKKYKVEALDPNLLKAIAKGGATMTHDPESDRNIHKKYGYRGDREEEFSDDDYDEWGNLKAGRKVSAHVVPGERRGPGRPKGSKRAIGAKFTGKSKLLNMSEARLIDESGSTLKHILDRFPAEIKAFEQGQDLEDNLYDALYDYYMSSGEMPYGVAKGRTGDPYEWVTERLVADLGLDETQEIIAQETDMDLNELSRLAGLKESCGTMSPMTQTGSSEKPEINVSTNYNSADDNKSITVTAQGDSATALAQLLKLSGLMGDASAEQSEEQPTAVVIAGHPGEEKEVEEERDPEYANTPDEKTAGIDAAVPSGDDLHKVKGANPNWHGDNAMRTTQFEDNDPIANLGRRLMKEYESIKVAK
jgi:hypothetical protein